MRDRIRRGAGAMIVNGPNLFSRGLRRQCGSGRGQEIRRYGIARILTGVRGAPRGYICCNTFLRCSLGIHVCDGSCPTLVPCLGRNAFGNPSECSAAAMVCDPFESYAPENRSFTALLLVSIQPGWICARARLTQGRCCTVRAISLTIRPSARFHPFFAPFRKRHSCCACPAILFAELRKA